MSVTKLAGPAPQPRPSTRPSDLAARGLIAHADVASLDAVVERFQMRITDDILAAIDPTEPLGPLARQFVPDRRELDVRPYELTDPIGDEVFTPVRGVTHRYPDRVLLKPTHLCQVYCRFCFRREKVGDGAETLNDTDLDAALAYIASRPEIFEVILTGGDPLVLSDRRLKRILDGLEAIAHVGVVRLHTRVITADPSRMTPECVRLFRRRYAVWFGVHVNHPFELQEPATAALARLADGGVALVSQTVLLAGVNDDVEVLRDLMRGLVRRRVKPYYLHHLDFAEGTSHFRVSIARGRALVSALRGTLTGLAQPTYVLDIPGGFGKVPIEPDWVTRLNDGSYQVRDWQGRLHRYVDPTSD